MSVYSVTPSNAAINFAPETEAAEILQNVATILATVRYTVPYDRAIGINPEYLDGPMQLAQAKATADIISSIRTQEPRAQVVDISFTGDGAEGILKPTVRVNINE